jgi:hypothetical protein
MGCSKCGKELPESELYAMHGTLMCDDCAMRAGLFPLEHSGARRDRISENERRLTVWWSEEG